MRPIFSPSARVNECCPSRVGLGSVGGFNGAAFALADFDFTGMLFSAGEAASLATSFAVAGCLYALPGAVSFGWSVAFESRASSFGPAETGTVGQVRRA